MSPYLAEELGPSCVIPMPGKEQHQFGGTNTKMVMVQRMAKVAYVLPTKTRPKKIAFIGDDGKTEFWMHAGTSAAWWAMTQRFARGAAVSSMLGALIGLGDRHLDNVLVNLTNGQIVHVDYNVCFEKGRSLRVPEIVSFRLTGNIAHALGPTRVEGTFRLSCERVLEMLRSDKQVLFQLLETFKFDPTLDFSFLQGSINAAGKSHHQEIAATVVHRIHRKLLGHELVYNNANLGQKGEVGKIGADQSQWKPAPEMFKLAVLDAIAGSEKCENDENHGGGEGHRILPKEKEKSLKAGMDWIETEQMSVIEQVEILANDQGNKANPSVVALTDTEHLVGDGAKDQMAQNPSNTVFNTKRQIGRMEIKHWPFKAVNQAFRGHLAIFICLALALACCTSSSDAIQIVCSCNPASGGTWSKTCNCPASDFNEAYCRCEPTLYPPARCGCLCKSGRKIFEENGYTGMHAIHKTYGYYTGMPAICQTANDSWSSYEWVTIIIGIITIFLAIVGGIIGGIVVPCYIWKKAVGFKDITGILTADQIPILPVNKIPILTADQIPILPVNKIPSVNQRVNDLEERQRGFVTNEQLNTVENSLNDKINVETLQGELTELRRTVASNEELTELRRTVDSKTEELTQLRRTVASNEELTELRRTVDSKTEELTQLRRTVASNEELTKLRIDSKTEELTQLRRTVDSKTEELKELRTKVEKGQTKQQNRINDLESKQKKDFANLEKKLQAAKEQHSKDISSLKEQHSKDISSLKEQHSKDQKGHFKDTIATLLQIRQLRRAIASSTSSSTTTVLPNNSSKKEGDENCSQLMRPS